METELKLSLRQQDVPALLAHPLLATSGNVQRLRNTYFDTPALDLKQRRIADGFARRIEATVSHRL